MAACTTVVLLGVGSFAADDWTMLQDTQVLQIESRPYAGSDLQEIRGTTYLRSSLNAVMALLRDASYNRQWVYRSGGARILEEEGYERAYVHGIVVAPWPMQDRDTVVRFDYRQSDDGEITIDIVNFPQYVDPMDGYVRVPDFGGYWRLTPIGPDCVKVVYQVYGDPGGWIPVWIANLAAQTSVQRTLENMPAAVRRYEGARNDSVREVSGLDTAKIKCPVAESDE